MINAKKAYQYLAVVLVSAFVLLGAFIWWFSSVVEQENTNAAETRGALVELQKAREQYANDLKTKDGEIRDLRENVEKLSKALAQRPVPPKPPTAPAEPLPLARDLCGAGLRPNLVVFPTPETDPSRLSLGDAQKVWNWQKEAARVPGFEARDAASQELIVGLNNENKALGDRVALGDKNLAACDEQLHQQAALNEAVKKQMEAQRRKDRLEKILYGVGGLGFGALLKSLVSK